MVGFNSNKDVLFVAVSPYAYIGFAMDMTEYVLGVIGSVNGADIVADLLAETLTSDAIAILSPHLLNPMATTMFVVPVASLPRLQLLLFRVCAFD